MNTVYLKQLLVHKAGVENNILDIEEDIKHNAIKLERLQNQLKLAQEQLCLTNEQIAHEENK